MELKSHVHKAKGLEFPVVIVPFADKKIYTHPSKKFGLIPQNFWEPMSGTQG